MKHNYERQFRVYDPDNDGEEIQYTTLKELREILGSWLLTDAIIEEAYGTTEIKYAMSPLVMAQHLYDGYMGLEFKKYGDKHLRANKILAVLDGLG